MPCVLGCKKEKDRYYPSKTLGGKREAMILQGIHKDAFMKLVDELAEKSPILFSYGIHNNHIILSYNMVDTLIKFSESHKINNVEIFWEIKREYRNALMNTEVWKTRFCFEDIYNESDQSFKYIIKSLSLRELRKFMDNNNWEKGMQAGIMADWDVVANTCAGESVMPSFIYYLFKRENGKWKKIDEESYEIKSIDAAKAGFIEFYGTVIDRQDYYVLFRRIEFK